MDSEDFGERVAGLAALADPIRRELYLFVAAQPGPVSRDRAAEGVTVPRHTAKFHLDKLVEQGLLATEFQRLSGRQGPGAGRPTKLYRRSSRELSVTLPARRYDLAGQLLARAIVDSTRTGAAATEMLHTAAAECGRALGDQALRDVGPRPGPEQQVSAACAVLTDHGYEPRREDAIITLANCPFHALARAHTELVCGMNLALIGAIAEHVGGGTFTARLDPADDRCCVVLDTR